jgi:hypothetical protein
MTSILGEKRCNMKGRIGYLISTFFVGILLLLIVEVIIRNAPSSSEKAAASTNPSTTTILDERLNMEQVCTETRPCHAEASSVEKKEYSADKAIDGSMSTRWSSRFSDPQWISIDMSMTETISRVVLYWEAAYGKNYQIHVSEDGETWYTAFITDTGDGLTDVITFDPVSVRHVRMYGILRGTEWGYSLWEFEVYATEEPAGPLPPRFDECEQVLPILKEEGDPLDYYTLKAQQCSPQGHYPRWFYDQLGYWTVVGSPGSEQETQFSDDGTIGFLHRAPHTTTVTKGFSLMPYLTIEGELITAFDTETTTHSLEGGYLPFPEVKWYTGGMEFSQKVFPYEADEGDSHNYIWYALRNKGSNRVSGQLYLTIRPFQVTPRWMYGGLVAIESIEVEGGNRFKVNGNNGFSAITAPDDFGAVAYKDGEIMDFIEKGQVPTQTSVTSTTYASAALEYTYSLEPGAEKDLMFAIPMDQGIDESGLPSSSTEVLGAFNESKAMWKGILDRVEIDIPDQDIVNTLKSNIAYIIAQKDSRALQPGSDNYDRSWMRDGAVMGAALLRTGYFTKVKDYLGWVASFQGEDGLIPPIIHSEGYVDDRFNEWDSQGEFIFLVSDYYKFTKDREFLEQVFPSVVTACTFLETLRKQRLTPEYENTRFYGILPPSICHEGYQEGGMHCYWDDFWALEGWQEARKMAGILGRNDPIPWIDNEEKDFRKCLVDSITRTMGGLGIEYIPGSADAGDFDAAATAVSVWPTEQTGLLEEGDLSYALENTLDKYYQEIFLPRLEQGLQFGYTPYEMRTATAYLMLGQKDKTLKMLNFILQDRRPLEWNHWGEVVYPGYREPGYVGDMPHSWIGAIYVNLIRSLFVYEKDAELIFGDGIDEKWLEQQKQIRIDNFPTYYGNIGYTLSKRGNVLTVTFSESANADPERGFVFKSPFSDKSIVSVIIDGQGWERFTHDEVYFDRIPREIVVAFAPSRIYLPVVLKNLNYSMMALLTHHDRYVTAMDGCPLLKQEPILSDCGWFILQHLDDGQVALVTCHNRYVTAPITGTTDLDWALGQEPEPGDCGRFIVHDLGGGKFAFETCAHRYFTALDSNNRPLEEQWLVIAETDKVRDWERFTLQYP